MKTDQATELSTLNPIRVETALSRFPVHRLARKGSIDIDIREANENGGSIRWEVDYSKKHGQPGPLAYKLDTLIVNRRIEEAARPIPRIIRLGSLRDICRELGVSEGENVTTIRKALRQNAFAGITAKTTYKQSDGTVRTLEADFNRYSVVFTGEKLPDGRKADAVYIILNDVFMRVINGAMTRPLNYDYLKSLSPAPQRFYELLSYQMYAALKYDRPRAKLVYSEFCSHAPQTRHSDWERVRSQMNKVHRPHRESGYIVGVDYQQTTDDKGVPDWIMFYNPGPKARAEFRAFTKRGGPVLLEVDLIEVDSRPQLAGPETSPLEAVLIGWGISPVASANLVQQHSEDVIRTQLEHMSFLTEKKPEKIADPAAYLVGAIREGYAAPKGFISKAERERRVKAQTEARKHREVAQLKERAATEAKEARDKAERQAVETYWESLSQAEQQALDKAAADADPALTVGLPASMKKLTERLRRDKFIRSLLVQQGMLPAAE